MANAGVMVSQDWVQRYLPKASREVKDFLAESGLVLQQTPQRHQLDRHDGAESTGSQEVDSEALAGYIKQLPLPIPGSLSRVSTAPSTPPPVFEAPSKKRSQKHKAAANSAVIPFSPKLPAYVPMSDLSGFTFTNAHFVPHGTVGFQHYVVDSEFRFSV
mmetsp:Transcript_1534/g.3884  ORF Transcript_1534/g.3884 Transcript_1534/m.3884 type:complete len:159 (+) Transcript_1534:145-621(+)